MGLWGGGGYYDGGFQISQGEYIEREAQMGARWMVEDGKPCPCHESGWILTDFDFYVKCTMHKAIQAALSDYDDFDPSEVDDNLIPDPDFRSLVMMLKATKG